MVGEANTARHMGPPGHRVAMEQNQQARNLGLFVSADLKPTLQRQKAAKKVGCASCQLERTVGPRKPKFLPLVFKAFIPLHSKFYVRERRLYPIMYENAGTGLVCV